MTHETYSTYSTYPRIRKDGIIATFLAVVLKRLKEPPTWLKAVTTLEKAPRPHPLKLVEVPVTWMNV